MQIILASIKSQMSVLGHSDMNSMFEDWQLGSHRGTESLSPSSIRKPPSEHKLAKRVEKLKNRIHNHENYNQFMELRNEQTLLDRKLASVTMSLRNIRIFHKKRLQARKTDYTPGKRKNNRFKNRALKDVQVITQEVNQ